MFYILHNIILGVTTPKGRRGHTALVYNGSMLIYGGYRDLKGSSNELWAYHFGMYQMFIKYFKRLFKIQRISRVKSYLNKIYNFQALGIYTGTYLYTLVIYVLLAPLKQSV